MRFWILPIITNKPTIEKRAMFFILPGDFYQNVISMLFPIVLTDGGKCFSFCFVIPFPAQSVAGKTFCHEVVFPEKTNPRIEDKK